MLYLVATPIGNLEDITLRALRILREVNVVAAEDTRQTRKLLSHYAIQTPLVSYHEHSGPAQTGALIAQITREGKSIALVTDAGTPGISDPGVDLVAAAVRASVRVVPIPGASASLSALTASGLPCARFLFEGFLPRTRSTRLSRLHALAQESRTVVFYEAPGRVGPTLSEICTVFGRERRACVARELTKVFEEFRRDTLSSLAEYYISNPARGECAIVVEGSRQEISKKQFDLEDLDTERGLLKALAAASGVPNKELYKSLVELKRQNGSNV